MTKVHKMKSNESSMARTAAHHGDWVTVQDLATQILQSEQDEAEGHFLFGLYEKSQNHPLRAIERFERALALDSDRYDAAIELANQLAVAQRNSEAAELVRKYAPKLSNSPLYLDLSGTILSDIGLTEEALPFYEKANELQPNIALFEGNLAACYNFLGKLKEAESIYKKLLAKHPSHQRNHYRLSRLRKASDLEHVKQMEQALNKSNASHDRNIFLYYALGKELEDLREWEKSFHYYKLAGDAATKVSRYHLDEDIAILEQIKTSCNANWLKQSPNKSYTTTKTPIFIIGLPRTGTTLTERILASHSKVQSLGETQFIPGTVRRISGAATRLQMSEEIIRYAAEADAAEIAKLYEESITYRLDESSSYYIEKLPYNFLFAGFIAKAFPNAKIILLNRNSADSCFSIYKQPFTWAYKYSYNLENLGNYYLKYNELRDHWRHLIGDRLIEVTYEELTRQPTSSIREILYSVGLPEEESCYKFHENKTASTTASSAQIREKMYSTSVGKWEYFRSQLKPLTDIFDRNGITYE